MKTKLLFSAFFLLTICFFKAQDDNFYKPSKVFRPIENVTYEDFSLPVQNDTITGIILKPQSKVKATVLFFHGAGGNVSSYMFMTKPLVDKDYQVVMVDFRGYGKSTGKPTHLNVASDGQAFFDAMIKRPDIVGTKIILYGASLGSQVAAHLARNNKDKIAGLVMDGSLSSFTDIAMYYKPEYKEMISKYVISPYAAKEDLQDTEGLPKLFIHSKEDKDVPYEEGFENYSKASLPKEFIAYAGKHLEAMKTDSEKIIMSIEKMIMK
ncbi:pimeloyl-ACP methyl ester carboxylesterase [Chryseobacterium sp. SORGH_AS 447]|uniref:alpha/beta hydrolase family protein n=1 Tax=Chryseobacterium sp. SORGH_AS_0447 TaxID=3041769 RepID=UPI00278B593D|nr:alpha/beta fold hydrolase [Chryseobacterium sp. SORGH_AS_0447]MDQ1160770.1 pimeloyl-ACP methyl ester carboxylesterase [Chryseobacterium sp. SORGH_AS_0447]